MTTPTEGPEWTEEDLATEAALRSCLTALLTLPIGVVTLLAVVQVKEWLFPDEPFFRKAHFFFYVPLTAGCQPVIGRTLY